MCVAAMWLCLECKGRNVLQWNIQCMKIAVFFYQVVYEGLPLHIVIFPHHLILCTLYIALMGLGLECKGRNVLQWNIRCMKTAVFFYQVVYEGLPLHIVVFPPSPYTMHFVCSVYFCITLFSEGHSLHVGVTGM